MPICIFCGQQGLKSREHIFPAWLQRYLGVAGEELQIISQTDPPKTVRTLVYGRHLNGHVCRECNNGWMCNLEAAAMPLIIELLESDTARTLNDDEIHTLGLWISKTGLTLHNASPYAKVIPDRHYQLAFEGKAPAHYTISIAQLNEPLAQPAWIQDQNWIGLSKHFSGEELIAKTRETYRVAFSFGRFAARITYFPLEPQLFPLEEGVQFIHPRQRQIVWPPARAIDDLWELNTGLVVPPPLPPFDINDFLAGGEQENDEHPED